MIWHYVIRKSLRRYSEVHHFLRGTELFGQGAVSWRELHARARQLTGGGPSIKKGCSQACSGSEGRDGSADYHLTLKNNGRAK